MDRAFSNPSVHCFQFPWAPLRCPLQMDRAVCFTDVLMAATKAVDGPGLLGSSDNAENTNESLSYFLQSY